MICICGLPCHESPSGDQWKVGIGGLGDVLLQIQNRDGEQARIPLRAAEAASLVMDIEKAISALHKGRQEQAGAGLAPRCPLCGHESVGMPVFRTWRCPACGKVFEADKPVPAAQPKCPIVCPGCEQADKITITGAVMRCDRCNKVYATPFLMDFDSPRDKCRKHGVQACHFCERLACGDNTSPGAELLRAAKKLVSLPWGAEGTGTAVAFLCDAVKKLEEMG